MNVTTLHHISPGSSGQGAAEKPRECISTFCDQILKWVLKSVPQHDVVMCWHASLRAWAKAPW